MFNRKNTDTICPQLPYGRTETEKGLVTETSLTLGPSDVIVAKTVTVDNIDPNRQADEVTITCFKITEDKFQVNCL